MHEENITKLPYKVASISLTFIEKLLVGEVSHFLYNNDSFHSHRASVRRLQPQREVGHYGLGRTNSYAARARADASHRLLLLSCQN